MAGRKRRDSGVQIEGTSTDPVVFQVAADPLPIKDRMAVEILLEIIAARGNVNPGFVDTAVDAANQLADRLGWK